MIRPATSAHAAQICDTYNHYVLRTTITFEEQPVSTEDMKRRMDEVQRALPWLVWEEEGKIRGFCYADKWKVRFAYRYSVESMLYLQPEFVSKGFGSRLHTALLASLRERGMHSTVAGIAVPNQASVALHEKFAFQKIAHFKEIAWKFGRWIDVGYWQLCL